MSACKSTSCTGSGFARLDMTYDGEGHRIRLVETPASGAATTTDFRYQGDAVTSEVSVTGGTAITRTFTTDESGAIIKVAISGDPVSLHNGTYLVTWNGHGDAVALSKIDTGTGALTAANRYTYTTWGTPSTTTHNSFADLRFRYLYVGQYDVHWDHSTAVPAGLLYMHARHYSPEFGRFLQPDPSALEHNFYEYAGNSPVTKVDPDGNICFAPIIGQLLCGAAIRVGGGAVIGWISRFGPQAPRAAAVITANRDSLNRITSVATVLSKGNIGMGTRVTAAGRRLCCKGLTGYDSGHLIARILGGRGGASANNLVPILTKVNRGEMARFESGIRNWLQKGVQVEVKIRVNYSGNSTIPESITYTYKLLVYRGPTYTRTFLNK